jgi:FlaA1/EpsC-like NDP-sugar epimerase
MFIDLLRNVSQTDRASKRLILVVYDVLAMSLALWAAFSVRLGYPYWPNNTVVPLAAVISFGIGVVGLYHLRVYHIVLRYFDMRTVSRILSGAAVAAVAWVIAIYFTRAPMASTIAQGFVPRSVGFIYCGFLFVLLFMGRYVMALLIATVANERPKGSRSGRKNIAIYGANAAGISLADSVRADHHYRLKAFLDDDVALQGQIAAGVPIYSPKALPELAKAAKLDEVFLAMPKATRSQRLSAISRVAQVNLRAKTVPAPEEIVSGRFTVSDVRPINVNDLLRRDSVEPLTDLIRQAVKGNSILVTGAGGSIGSEICRQILRARPHKLVLLDHSEFGLYTIEQELEEIARTLREEERPIIIPVIGSMMNDLLVRETIRSHGVDTIYHAAAYKHVPLLEHNEVVGVENNVVGTLILARAAVDANITRFTMISTDKAVRPESVMGASKRAAELVIQAFADRDACQTRFGIVRFGNVLDSSGSVVQRFRDQISQGGPVTVTHPDVTRFFMSIPEATQLVLQASAMAHHGEVFVLDMGEPVKIADLARNMISLSGLSVREDDNPSGDIEIIYVGLRPGEKLYEELFVGADAIETTHPRIRMARERSMHLSELEDHLAGLRAAISAGNPLAVRERLNSLTAPDRGGEPRNMANVTSFAEESSRRGRHSGGASVFSQT